MTQPQGQQLERVDAMVSRYENDYALVLPPSFPAAMFVRLAVGKLRTDPALLAAARANPDSLYATLMECARLGHEPGTNEYALTVFNVKVKDEHGKDTGKFRPEIVGIEQYQGVIERMLNSGVVLSVRAEVVRHNDFYDPRDNQPFTPPDHRPAWFTTNPPGTQRHPWFVPESERGEMIGVYAYAVMESGAISRVVKMSKEEVMKHKAAARSQKFWTGPWEQDMWIKTAVHKLETWVSTSAEQARRRADRQATSGTSKVESNDRTDTEVIDAMVTEDGK